MTPVSHWLEELEKLECFSNDFLLLFFSIIITTDSVIERVQLTLEKENVYLLKIQMSLSQLHKYKFSIILHLFSLKQQKLN